MYIIHNAGIVPCYSARQYHCANVGSPASPPHAPSGAIDVLSAICYSGQRASKPTIADRSGRVPNLKAPHRHSQASPTHHPLTRHPCARTHATWRDVGGGRMWAAWYRPYARWIAMRTLPCQHRCPRAAMAWPQVVNVPPPANRVPRAKPWPWGGYQTQRVPRCGGRDHPGED